MSSYLFSKPAKYADGRTIPNPIAFDALGFVVSILLSGVLSVYQIENDPVSVGKLSGSFLILFDPQRQAMVLGFLAAVYALMAGYSALKVAPEFKAALAADRI